MPRVRWQLARPVVDLFGQVNRVAPSRSRISDGTIGDAAHAATKSDHNPRKGFVRAGDITNDPRHFNVHAWMRELVRRGLVPECVKYMISNGEIWDEDDGWDEYEGKNPHDHHGHVSIKDGYENTAGVNWHTDIFVRPAPTPKPKPTTPKPTPAPTEEDDDMSQIWKNIQSGAHLEVAGWTYRHVGPQRVARFKLLGGKVRRLDDDTIKLLLIDCKKDESIVVK